MAAAASASAGDQGDDDVWLYFWDDPRDKKHAHRGWWLGPGVGSDEYFATCPGSRAELPTPDKCDGQWTNWDGAAADLVVALDGATAARVVSSTMSGVVGLYQKLNARGAVGAFGKGQVVFRRQRGAVATAAGLEPTAGKDDQMETTCATPTATPLVGPDHQLSSTAAAGQQPRREEGPHAPLPTNGAAMLID